MSLSTGTKLNKILVSWPSGAVYLSSYLKGLGFGYDLQMRYREGNWLISLGQGALAKKGDPIDWQGGLFALQEQTNLKIHVGGKTALQLSGLAHYIPMGEKQRVHIFGVPKTKLPAWFLNYKWNAIISFHRSSLFPASFETGFIKHTHKNFSITMSSPERAFLEFLDLVPQRETFDEASLLAESLSTLRPKMVQELLESCSSVKVKRLFLFLAEKQQHSWLKRLDLKNVDLGIGNRQIIKGGKLDLKYKITVPEEL